MAFPPVIVECAFNSILGEETNAQTGWTEITKFVDTVSGTLRGRGGYELDEIETGSITLSLDNADNRFTPGSLQSPYYPMVRANRRLRIRGKNLQQPNIARAGGQEETTHGFFLSATHIKDATDGVTVKVTGPVRATHVAGVLGFTGDLADETTHMEGTLKSGATAGTYRVLTYWAPVELGVRLTHSAYVWRVSGTEPGSTTVRLQSTYFDADGAEITANGDDYVEWASATPATPTRRTFADLPPSDAKYVEQSVVVITTSTTSGDIVYGICGIQTELSSNLVPSISGYYDYQAWEIQGGGTVAQAGPDRAGTYVLTTWAADSVELRTRVPHLVPGDEYTFAVEVKKAGGGPDILLTGDDGLTGTTLSIENTWTTMRHTFVANRPEVNVKLIPQGATTGSHTLQTRLARCSPADAALPLAASTSDTDETVWVRPLPIFEGWIERWPIHLTASSSTISVTANDRLKRLGETLLESTLRETLLSDDVDFLMPLTDSADDSQGKASILGTWADESGRSQLEPHTTKLGPGVATFVQGGFIGPTDEDAAKFVQASSTQGYVLALDYSTATTPTTPPTTAPVPNPGGTTFTKTYYATWSRSFDEDNDTRTPDSAHMYHGSSSSSSDINGNQTSMMGFNWSAIAKDLTGAVILGMSVTAYADDWDLFSGGTAFLGTHNYLTKPSSYVAGNVSARRWTTTKWQRHAWRTVDIGAAAGVEFQSGTSKGILFGPGNNDRLTYGIFRGATDSKRPYITIKYRK